MKLEKDLDTPNQFTEEMFRDAVELCIDTYHVAKKQIFKDKAKELLDRLKKITQYSKIYEDIMIRKERFVPREKYRFEPQFAYELYLESAKRDFEQKKSERVAQLNGEVIHKERSFLNKLLGAF